MVNCRERSLRVVSQNAALPQVIRAELKIGIRDG